MFQILVLQRLSFYSACWNPPEIVFPALGQWFSIMEGPDMMALGTSISGVFHVMKSRAMECGFLQCLRERQLQKQKQFDNEHPVLRVIFGDPYLQIFSRKTVLYGV
jgi:hypothetical protein